MELEQAVKDVRAIVDRTFNNVWVDFGAHAAVLEHKMSVESHRALADPLVSVYNSFLSAFNRSYLDHCQRINRLAPVNHLPDDVLTSIFACGDVADRLAASCVCKRWRTVAVHDARLWTTLSFHPRQNVELVQHLLRRAQSMPVRLCLPASSRHFLAALPRIAAENMHQLEEFVVRGRDDAIDIMVHVFFPTAPRLRALRIEGVLDHSRILFSLRPGASFPALQQIHLVRTSIPPETWRAFPAVVDIAWTPFPTGGIINDLYNVLVSCPALRRLRIYGMNSAHSSFNEAPSKSKMQRALQNLDFLSLMSVDSGPISADLIPHLPAARHVLTYCSDDLEDYAGSVLSHSGPASSCYMRDSYRAGERLDHVIDGQLRDICVDDATGARRELLRIKKAHLLLTPHRAATLRTLSLPLACWAKVKTPGVAFPVLESLVLLSVPLVRPSKKTPACLALRNLTIVLDGSKSSNTTIDTLVSKVVSDCPWPIQRLVVVADSPALAGKLVPQQPGKRAHEVHVCGSLPDSDRAPFSDEEVLQDRLPDDWQ